MADLLDTIEASQAMRRHKIFRPYAIKKAEFAARTGQQFVHYTSAATACLILKNSEIWMRQSSAMNDFREIEFGQTCIRQAWQKHRHQLNLVFDRIDARLAPRLWEWLCSWEQRIRTETYLTCVSEHRSRENDHGRLSMWRAYGGSNGVALVVDGGPLLRGSDALGAYASPVGYHTIQSFADAFAALLSRVEQNVEFLAQQGSEGVFQELCHTLHYAMLCTKHEGFREEREWRIVRSPAFNSPSAMTAQVEVVGGVPQTILALKLIDQPSLGLDGIVIPKFVKRVIVGPTQYPLVVADALASCLKMAGVEAPEKVISFSDIPLRS
jgi:hypothetical protein